MKGLQASDSRAQFFSLILPLSQLGLRPKADPHFHQLLPLFPPTSFGLTVAPCRLILQHSPQLPPLVWVPPGRRLHGSSSRSACSSCRRCLHLLNGRY